MLKIIQDIEDMFTAAQKDISVAIGFAKAKVSNAIAIPENELKAAEVDFFTRLEGADVSISQAFAAGAAYATRRIAEISAPTAQAVATQTPAEGSPNMTAADDAPGQQA